MGLLDFLGLGSDPATPSAGLLASDPTAAASTPTDPAAQLKSDIRTQTLLGLAAGLLKSSGPSFTPHSFGQDLGSGIDGALAGRQNAVRNASAQQQLQAQSMQNQNAQDMLNYRRQQLAGLGLAPTNSAGAQVAMAPAPLGSAPPVAPPSPPSGGVPAVSGGLAAPSAGDVTPQILQGVGAPASAPPPPMPMASLPSSAAGAASGGAAAPAAAAVPVGPVPYVPRIGQTQGGPVPLIDPVTAIRQAKISLAYGDTKGAQVWMSQIKPPDGYQYFSDGSLRAVAGGPSDPSTHLALGTADTLGKNLQMRGPDGTIINQPGAVAAGAQVAGANSAATSQGALPADLTKIVAGGNQARQTQTQGNAQTPTTVTVQTGVDAQGLPAYTPVQTTKLAASQLGPVAGMPVQTPQQKALLEAWQNSMKPATIRNDQASIVVPGAGQPMPGMPATPSPAPMLAGPPNTVLRVPGRPLPAGPPLPVAPIAPQSPAPAPVARSMEANPVAAAPGTIIQGKTGAQDESEKKRADLMTQWQTARQGNVNQLQQLQSLSDAAQSFNTGKLSPGTQDMAAWIASTGADPTAVLGDPSKGEEFNKIASNFLTQQVSNLSSQPAHAAFGTIGAGMPSPDKRPDTNHEITAQMTARLRWENDLADAAAQQFPTGVPSTSFVADFTKTHPTSAYLDQARQDIPPFAGMTGSPAKPITIMGAKPPANPMPNRWYASNKFPTGKAMFIGNGQWDVPAAGQ